jgi:hypothetical protein
MTETVMEISCHELVELVTDYLEGALPPGLGSYGKPRSDDLECQLRKAPSRAASACGSSCSGVSWPVSSIVFRICSR